MVEQVLDCQLNGNGNTQSCWRWHTAQYSYGLFAVLFKRLKLLGYCHEIAVDPSVSKWLKQCNLDICALSKPWLTE